MLSGYPVIALRYCLIRVILIVNEMNNCVCDGYLMHTVAIGWSLDLMISLRVKYGKCERVSVIKTLGEEGES